LWREYGTQTDSSSSNSRINVFAEFAELFVEIFDTGAPSASTNSRVVGHPPNVIMEICDGMLQYISVTINNDDPQDAKTWLNDAMRTSFEWKYAETRPKVSLSGQLCPRTSDSDGMQLVAINKNLVSDRVHFLWLCRCLTVLVGYEHNQLSICNSFHDHFYRIILELIKFLMHQLEFFGLLWSDSHKCYTNADTESLISPSTMMNLFSDSDFVLSVLHCLVQTSTRLSSVRARELITRSYNWNNFVVPQPWRPSYLADFCVCCFPYDDNRPKATGNSMPSSLNYVGSTPESKSNLTEYACRQYLTTDQKDADQESSSNILSIFTRLDVMDVLVLVIRKLTHLSNILHQQVVGLVTNSSFTQFAKVLYIWRSGIAVQCEVLYGMLTCMVVDPVHNSDNFFKNGGENDLQSLLSMADIIDFDIVFRVNQAIVLDGMEVRCCRLADQLLLCRSLCCMRLAEFIEGSMIYLLRGGRIVKTAESTVRNIRSDAESLSKGMFTSLRDLIRWIYETFGRDERTGTDESLGHNLGICCEFPTELRTQPFSCDFSGFRDSESGSRTLDLAHSNWEKQRDLSAALCKSCIKDSPFTLSSFASEREQRRIRSRVPNSQMFEDSPRHSSPDGDYLLAALNRICYGASTDDDADTHNLGGIVQCSEYQLFFECLFDLLHSGEPAKAEFVQSAGLSKRKNCMVGLFESLSRLSAQNRVVPKFQLHFLMFLFRCMNRLPVMAAKELWTLDLKKLLVHSPLFLRLGQDDYQKLLPVNSKIEATEYLKRFHTETNVLRTPSMAPTMRIDEVDEDAEDVDVIHSMAIETWMKLSLHPKTSELTTLQVPSRSNSITGPEETMSPALAPLATTDSFDLLSRRRSSSLEFVDSSRPSSSAASIVVHESHDLATVSKDSQGLGDPTLEPAPVEVAAGSEPVDQFSPQVDGKSTTDSFSRRRGCQSLCAVLLRDCILELYWISAEVLHDYNKRIGSDAGNASSRGKDVVAIDFIEFIQLLSHDSTDDLVLQIARWFHMFIQYGFIKCLKPHGWSVVLSECLTLCRLQVSTLVAHTAQPSSSGSVSTVNLGAERPFLWPARVAILQLIYIICTVSESINWLKAFTPTHFLSASADEYSHSSYVTPLKAKASSEVQQLMKHQKHAILMRLTLDVKCSDVALFLLTRILNECVARIFPDEDILEGVPVTVGGQNVSTTSSIGAGPPKRDVTVYEALVHDILRGVLSVIKASTNQQYPAVGFAAAMKSVCYLTAFFRDAAINSEAFVLGELIGSYGVCHPAHKLFHWNSHKPSIWREVLATTENALSHAGAAALTPAMRAYMIRAILKLLAALMSRNEGNRFKFYKAMMERTRKNVELAVSSAGAGPEVVQPPDQPITDSLVQPSTVKRLVVNYAYMDVVQLLLAAEPDMSVETVQILLEMMFDGGVEVGEYLKSGLSVITAFPSPSTVESSTANEDSHLRRCLIRTNTSILQSSLIENISIIPILIDLATFCGPSLQDAIFATFLFLVKDSSHASINLSRIKQLHIPLVDVLLDVYAKLASATSQSYCLHLIQRVGKYSITMSQLKKLFRVVNGGKPKSHEQWKLNVSAFVDCLAGMVVSQRKEPKHYFQFSGHDSGLTLPELAPWKSSRGFAFSCWFSLTSTIPVLYHDGSSLAGSQPQSVRSEPPTPSPLTGMTGISSPFSAASSSKDSPLSSASPSRPNMSRKYSSRRRVIVVEHEYVLLSLRQKSGTGIEVVIIHQTSPVKYSLQVNLYNDKKCVHITGDITKFLKQEEHSNAEAGSGGPAATWHHIAISLSVQTFRVSSEVTIYFDGQVTKHQAPLPKYNTNESVMGMIGERVQLFREQRYPGTASSAFIGDISTVFFFSDALSDASARMLGKLEPSYSQDFQELDDKSLALNTVLIINPVMCQGDFIVDNTPEGNMLRWCTSLPITKKSPGTVLNSIRYITDELDCLGGIKTLLPFLRDACGKQRAGNVVPLGALAADDCGPQLCIKILDLLMSLIKNLTSIESKKLLDGTGFALIAHHLETVNPSYLTPQLLDCCMYHVKGLSWNQVWQEKAMKQLICNMKIWELAPYSVHLKLLNYINEYVCNYSEAASRIIPVQTLLDYLKNVYVCHPEPASSSLPTRSKSPTASITVKRSSSVQKHIDEADGTPRSPCRSPALPELMIPRDESRPAISRSPSPTTDILTAISAEVMELHNHDSADSADMIIYDELAVMRALDDDTGIEISPREDGTSESGKSARGAPHTDLASKDSDLLHHAASRHLFGNDDVPTLRAMVWTLIQSQVTSSMSLNISIEDFETGYIFNQCAEHLYSIIRHIIVEKNDDHKLEGMKLLCQLFSSPQLLATSNAQTLRSIAEQPLMIAMTALIPKNTRTVQLYALVTICCMVRLCLYVNTKVQPGSSMNMAVSTPGMTPMEQSPAMLSATIDQLGHNEATQMGRRRNTLFGSGSSSPVPQLERTLSSSSIASSASTNNTARKSFSVSFQVQDIATLPTPPRYPLLAAARAAARNRIEYRRKTMRSLGEKLFSSYGRSDGAAGGTPNEAMFSSQSFGQNFLYFGLSDISISTVIYWIQDLVINEIASTSLPSARSDEEDDSDKEARGQLQVIFDAIQLTLCGEECTYLLGKIDHIFQRASKGTESVAAKIYDSNADSSANGAKIIHFPRLLTCLTSILERNLFSSRLRLYYVHQLCSKLTVAENKSTILRMIGWQRCLLSVLMAEQNNVSAFAASMSAPQDELMMRSSSTQAELESLQSETVCELLLDLCGEFHRYAFQWGVPTGECYLVPKDGAELAAEASIQPKDIIEEFRVGARVPGSAIIRETLAYVKVYAQQGLLDNKEYGFTLLRHVLQFLKTEHDATAFTPAAMLSNSLSETKTMRKRLLTLNMLQFTNVVLEFITIPCIQPVKVRRQSSELVTGTETSSSAANSNSGMNSPGQNKVLTPPADFQSTAAISTVTPRPKTVTSPVVPPLKFPHDLLSSPPSRTPSPSIESSIVGNADGAVENALDDAEAEPTEVDSVDRFAVPSLADPSQLQKPQRSQQKVKVTYMQPSSGRQMDTTSPRSGNRSISMDGTRKRARVKPADASSANPSGSNSRIQRLKEYINSKVDHRMSIHQSNEEMRDGLLDDLFMLFGQIETFRALLTVPSDKAPRSGYMFGSKKAAQVELLEYFDDRDMPLGAGSGPGAFESSTPRFYDELGTSSTASSSAFSPRPTSGNFGLAPVAKVTSAGVVSFLVRVIIDVFLEGANQNPSAGLSSVASYEYRPRSGRINSVDQHRQAIVPMGKRQIDAMTKLKYLQHNAHDYFQDDAVFLIAKIAYAIRNNPKCGLLAWSQSALEFMLDLLSEYRIVVVKHLVRGIEDLIQQAEAQQYTPTSAGEIVSPPVRARSVSTDAVPVASASPMMTKSKSSAGTASSRQVEASRGNRFLSRAGAFSAANATASSAIASELQTLNLLKMEMSANLYLSPAPPCVNDLMAQYLAATQLAENPSAVNISDLMLEIVQKFLDPDTSEHVLKTLNWRIWDAAFNPVLRRVREIDVITATSRVNDMGFDKHAEDMQEIEDNFKQLSDKCVKEFCNAMKVLLRANK
jgi:hypothetical protein